MVRNLRVNLLGLVLYKKRIYRAAVSQRLRNTALNYLTPEIHRQLSRQYLKLGHLYELTSTINIFSNSVRESCWNENFSVNNDSTTKVTKRLRKMIFFRVESNHVTDPIETTRLRQIEKNRI